MIEIIDGSGFFKYPLLQTAINLGLNVLIYAILNTIIKTIIKKHLDPTNQVLANRVKSFVLKTILLFTILYQFNAFSDVLKAIVASTGVITLALSLAAQDAVGNLVNGFMIYTFRPFKIGDLIKISDYNITGYVIDISLRHTIIKTFENTEVIVPNSSMNKVVLENVSNTESKKVNFLYIAISYDSDLDKAMKIISEEVQKHPLFLDGRSDEEIAANAPVVNIKLINFGESSLDLRATVYSKDNAQGFSILSDLRIAIKKRFDEEGIEIPYPHQTIVMK